MTVAARSPATRAPLDRQAEPVVHAARNARANAREYGSCSRPPRLRSHSLAASRLARCDRHHHLSSQVPCWRATPAPTPGSMALVRDHHVVARTRSPPLASLDMTAIIISRRRGRVEIHASVPSQGGSRRGRLSDEIPRQKYLKNTNLTTQHQRGRTQGAPCSDMRTAPKPAFPMACWDPVDGKPPLGDGEAWLGMTHLVLKLVPHQGKS